MHNNVLMILFQVLITFENKFSLNIFKLNSEDVKNHFSYQNTQKKMNMMLLFSLFIKLGIQATASTYNYKGSAETYVAHGTYKIELWGVVHRGLSRVCETRSFSICHGYLMF